MGGTGGVGDENAASVRHNQICPIREGGVTTSKSQHQAPLFCNQTQLEGAESPEQTPRPPGFGSKTHALTLSKLLVDFSSQSVFQYY